MYKVVLSPQLLSRRGKAAEGAGWRLCEHRWCDRLTWSSYAFFSFNSLTSLQRGSDFIAVGTWNLMALARLFFYLAHICGAPATCRAFVGSRDTGEWARVPTFVELTAIPYTLPVCCASQTRFITNCPLWLSSPLPESGGPVCLQRRQVQIVDITYPNQLSSN